jgi:hypothetical protein
MSAKTNLQILTLINKIVGKALLSGSAFVFVCTRFENEMFLLPGLELGIPISGNGNAMTYALRFDEHVVQKML